MSYVSLWLPIPFLTRMILQIFLAGMAAGGLISVFLPPGLKSLISTADSLGLKERVITAWQLREDESCVAGLQREDARQAILNADFKRLYPLRFPVRPAILLAVFALLISVSYMMPGPARDDARRIEALKREVKEQTEPFKKVEENLEKKDTLTEKELEEIRDKIEALKAELKKARTEEDALKALSRAENELNKMDSQRQLRQLGNALGSNEMTKDLGDALKSESITDMKQALEKLGQKMEQGEISKDELAKMLEQSADQLENREMAKKLKQEAQQLASADAGSQSAVMGGLSGELSQMMGQQGSTGLGQALGKLSQALQQAKGAVSQVDNRLGTGTKTAQSGAAGGTQAGNQGNGNQMETSGDQQATMGGNGGQNESNSGGMGQSENGGGGGAGEGSTNKDAGNTGSEGSGAGRTPGERKEEEYERLYDPDRLGGENTPDMVNGQKQDGGQSQYTEAGNMPVQKGAVLPYREVLAHYREEAVSYMEDAAIPAAMKQIVKEYFESLE